MKIRRIIQICIMIIVGIGLNHELVAHSDHGKNIHIKAIAEILLEMNHLPNDQDKQALSDIVENEHSTDSEKAISMAIMNIQHIVSESDREALENIVANEESSGAIKNLAKSVLNFNHSVNQTDKRKLQMIVFKGS